MVRAHIFIYGEVQGVFFRRSAKVKAEELNLAGWVRNRPDGSVDSVVQGEKGTVLKYIAWCKKGPPFAKVENVEIEWRKNLENYSDFSIF